MFMKNLPNRVGFLVCPETKLKFTLHKLNDAEDKMRCKLIELRGTSSFKGYHQVLVREDFQVAYPVIDGIPIIMVPEMLGKKSDQRDFDLSNPKYAEAYEEMDYYNQVATKEAEKIHESSAYTIVEPVYKASKKELSSFPNPITIWIDAVYDCGAQYDAYNHMAPMEGKRVLQLGGKGIHAVKFLIAGAKEAWVITPIIGEARCAIALGKAFGVADRLYCVVAVAEELPFLSNSFDAIYSGGCLHHMVLDLAIKEASRVLCEGGKFSAVDPWRAPLHSIGTRIFGKREAAVHCHPLTKERIRPLYHAFKVVHLVQHGTLTRYPLLVLMKLGLRSSLSLAWQLNRIDNALCSYVPGMRRMGSSIASLGIK